MKQVRMNVLGTILFCCLFAMAGIAQRALKIPDDPKVIPPDFGTTKTTILVVNYGKKGIDKYLEKDFSKEYKGDYVIIDKDDLNSKEYKDVTKYRYAFSLVEDYVPGRFTAGTREAPEINYNINFTDRSNYTTYHTLMSTNFFSKLVKAYIEKLNEKLAANAQK